MTVAAGDALYFRINRRAGTTYDGTSWDPSVEYLAGGAASVRWVVTDHLGTPRMAADQSGSLAGVSRHDYLPFGKELPAGVGGRTTPRGYSVADGLRQGFTGYEKDQETGLHFAQARYYAGAQGRFTSCDPLIISTQHSANPQRWNAYTYVLNSPLGMSDPNGRNGKGSGGGRVIDVFITLSNREQKQVKMNWRGLERMADKLRREGKRDVTLNLYTADANQVNNKRVENSLSTPGRFTVIVGHSLSDSGHPAGKGGQGVDIGNGYIGSHGVTTVNPNGDHELGPIKAAAFFAVSCYPGEGFIRNVTKSLTKGSVAYYNSGGTEDGKTSIDAGEKAGFEIVKALILGQSPDEAAGAGQTVLNASEDPQDQDGESIVTIYPPDDRLDRR